MGQPHAGPLIFNEISNQVNLPDYLLD